MGDAQVFHVTMIVIQDVKPQPEPVTGKNCRYITGSVIARCSEHTLTSESQEVMVSLNFPVSDLGPDIEEALQIPISL